nr:unnamed protein product [Digitaria exilis]
MHDSAMAEWKWEWDCEWDSEEEARRALAVAEQRFVAGDVEGARHHARRALDLSPALPGAEQALAAYDVHAAAAPAMARPGCWYAALGLPHPPTTARLSDDVTHDAIKRQHRRLCLLVHPDKNRSAAAGGAFKLVQDAYEALKAIHPPPPPRDEERVKFWQAAAQDDVAPPRPPVARKEPPIARPAPRPAAAERKEPPIVRPAAAPRWAPPPPGPRPAAAPRWAPPPPGPPPQQPLCRCRHPCACAFYRPGWWR